DTAAPNQPLPPARHSPDFRSVVWFGEYHSFTKGQAAVVSILWLTWVVGVPDVGQETLLEKTELETPRLAKVFAGHAAWGTMIVPGETKGSFRLAEKISG